MYTSLFLLPELTHRFAVLEEAGGKRNADMFLTTDT